MTEIIWDPKARDFLEKLPAKDPEQILRKLHKDVRQNPKRYIGHLENKDVGKIRIGGYRLFVDYYANTDQLVIRSMRHRSNAYKRT